MAGEFDDLFTEDLLAPAAPSAPQEAQQQQQQPSLLDRAGAIASDIGTGITELPRAAVKGTRDAVQETMNFVQEGAQAFDRWRGIKPEDGIELPDLNAPKSVTGGIAKSVSQFVVGMVGLGKLTKPIEAAAGVAKAGKLAAAAVSSAKAATVGAVAFDPHGARLSDLFEQNLPALSNPMTRYLSADPFDTNAEGRLKNAIESIGMDVALGAALVAGTKAWKAMSDFRAGKVDHSVVEKAVKEAERADAALNAEPKAPEPTAAPDAAPQAPQAAASVERVQSPTAGAPDGVLPPKAKITEVTPEEMDSILTGLKADSDALAQSGGSFEAAIANGHNFGRGGKVPWQKVAPDTPAEVEAFVARMAGTLEAKTNKARGGNADGVLTDSAVSRMVEQRAAAWGEDPAALMGQLAAAGKQSRTMAANMEAAFLIGERARADTYAMAMRIKAGDLSAWGGSETAAREELLKMFGVTQTLFEHGMAMRASAGRTMRRMRSDFAVDPQAANGLEALDVNKLVDAIMATGGDARGMKRLADPSMAARIMDVGQWMLVNNLLWGLRTHFVNFSTNVYMMGARPAERWIGSWKIGGEAGQRMRAEAQRQYVEMTHNFGDSFRAAVDTWRAGDSQLTPHSVEVNMAQKMNVAQMEFRPIASLADVAYNAVIAGAKTMGLPTRALGTVDELVKQTVYRSKVAARAHVEGAQNGLAGQQLTDYVRKAIDDSFDSAGRAIDQAAVQEARTSTFNQPLLQGTAGAGLQHFAANVPLVRLVLPFIQTPANVIRYGWKMTPGLNLLQTEYRQMLKGALGPEAQAQAVGQMSLGTLWMGTAASLAAAGMVTGGGPTDPKARKALMNTGWQPYSVVVPGENGKKTYVNFGRYDPIAMPFGIIADLMEVSSRITTMDGPTAEKTKAGALALAVALSKQMSQKTFLKSISDATEAFSDPDRSFGKFARGQAGNFVPFSSGLRFVNPDPHVREVRDMVDQIMATIPGLSDKVPPMRDAFGDPVQTHKGIWVNTPYDMVDHEVQRMAMQFGHTIGVPEPKVSGVDLREITMRDGRNAYQAYQDYAAKPSKNTPSLKESMAKLVTSPAYGNAPDGPVETKGSRLWLMASIASQYRTQAIERVKADPKVREAMSKSQMKVVDHYRKQQAAKAAKPPMQTLGDSFGVDLSAAK